MQSCNTCVRYIRKEKAKNDGFEFKSGKISLEIKFKIPGSVLLAAFIRHKKSRIHIFATNLYDLNKFKICDHRNYTLLFGSTKNTRCEDHNLLGLPFFRKPKALKI